MPALTRRQQEELTQRAQSIIEDDLKRYQERFPRLPPKISIRECQEAIGIAGGIRHEAAEERRGGSPKSGPEGEGIPGGSAEGFA